jgi:hypothetical protein
LAVNDLQNMTPISDFLSRKHLAIQHLRLSRRRETDPKVIKSENFVDAANSPPLRRLWQKNFQRSRITRYGFPTRRLMHRRLSRETAERRRVTNSSFVASILRVRSYWLLAVSPSHRRIIENAFLYYSTKT